MPQGAAGDASTAATVSFGIPVQGSRATAPTDLGSDASLVPLAARLRDSPLIFLSLAFLVCQWGVYWVIVRVLVK